MRVASFVVVSLALAVTREARAAGCFPEAVHRCDAAVTRESGAAPSRPRALTVGAEALSSVMPASVCAPAISIALRGVDEAARVDALRRLATTPCAEDAAVAEARLAFSLHREALLGDLAAGRAALALYDDVVPRLPALTLLPAHVSPALLHIARGHLAFAKGDAERALASYEDARLAGAGDEDLGQALHGAGLAASALVDGASGARIEPISAALDRWACATRSKPDHEAALRAHARLLAAAERPREAAALSYALAARGGAAARSDDALRFARGAAKEATRADSESCWAEVTQRTAILASLACDQPGQACDVLARAEHAARARWIDKRAAVIDAQGDPIAAALALADDTMGLAERCALSRLREGDRPRCERPERLLVQAAELFERAKVPLRAARVRALLLDPRFGLATTEEAELGLLRIARIHESLSDFDEAATWLEVFAATRRRVDLRVSALAHASELRAALGQVDEASRDAAALARLSSGARELPGVALAVARVAVANGQPSVALTALRRVSSRADLEPDERVEAGALEGEAWLALGAPGRARVGLSRAVELWIGQGERPGKGAEAAGRSALSLAGLAAGKERALALQRAIDRKTFPAAVRTRAALALADASRSPRAPLEACRRIATESGLVDAATRACGQRLAGLSGRRAEPLDLPALLAPAGVTRAAPLSLGEGH